LQVKNAKEANNKLVEVSDDLDDLLDHSEEDEELIEISRYQVLLNQLQQKILALGGYKKMAIIMLLRFTK
jgi:hypothetical protein